MYKHILLSTLKIKGGVKVERAQRRIPDGGLREDFEIQKDRVVRIESQDLEWRRFNSKDLRFTIMKNPQSRKITLSGARIEGDLIIDGLNDSLKEINIVDCEISGRVAIYNLKVRKITISGNASSVEVVNSEVRDLHICGEVDDEISLFNVGMKDSHIEINGSSRIVRLKNLHANELKFKVFKCALINGRELFVDTFFLPTDREVSLQRVNVKTLYFLQNGNSLGMAYSLKNAKLQF